MIKYFGIRNILAFSVLLAWVSLAATAVGGMKDGTKSEMTGERSGTLSGFEGHNASGKVTVSQDEEGNGYIDLSGIKVDRVPDGRVYLAKGGDYTTGVEVGLLKRFTGDVRFPIPGDVDADEYDSVVIWCKKFDVGIGRAFLDK